MRQSKTLFTIDECGLKIARNSVFDCHLLPVWRQMAIKNYVSNFFYLRSSKILAFSVASYPMWVMTRKITWHFCKNGSEELSINSNKQNYRVDLIVVQNIARYLQHVKLQNSDERTNGPAQMIFSTRLYDNVNRHKSSQSICCSNESSQGDNQIYKHTVIKQGKLLSIHGQS